MDNPLTDYTMDICWPKREKNVGLKEKIQKNLDNVVDEMLGRDNKNEDNQIERAQ